MGTICMRSALSSIILCLGLAGAVLADPSPGSAAKPSAGLASPSSAQQIQQQPDQSSVAIKVLPKTVPAASAAVTAALSCRDVDKALKLVGKEASMQGTVDTAYSPADHDIVILDFDKDYRHTITAVAMPASYPKLPDLAALNGKHVLVTGKVSLYRDKPEFIISSADQISIIK
jgi:DNA/RNA endonuclease YhcR with UshA esterase domain